MTDAHPVANAGMLPARFFRASRLRFCRADLSAFAARPEGD